jgi:cystathionine beta-lyase/cystathionine gamma-synthase
MDRKTRCAQGCIEEMDLGRPLAPVIVPTTSFGFDDQAELDRYYETGEGWVYSRYENPTVRQVERLLAGLEGADDAALFASGMAAISTLFLTLAGAGDRVAAQRELYGGSADLLLNGLPALGLEVVWLDREELANLDPERIAGCRLLYLETPINPTLRLVDLRRVAKLASRAAVPVAVDSTFATPILQRPLDHGADLVVHSATKYLGGHADLTGGVVAGRGDLVRRIALKRRSLGGVLDPFSAFLLQRGIRTLAVRMEAHCRGAGQLAEALAGHPSLERVLYPGLPGHPDLELCERQMDGAGGMVTLLLSGGARAAERLHDRLRLFRRAASLGGVESLVSIPVKTSHRYLDERARARVGVTPDMVRLSVGLESPADLLDDLERALAR